MIRSGLTLILCRAVPLWVGPRLCSPQMDSLKSMTRCLYMCVFILGCPGGHSASVLSIQNVKVYMETAMDTRLRHSSVVFKQVAFGAPAGRTLDDCKFLQRIETIEIYGNVVLVAIFFTLK